MRALLLLMSALLLSSSYSQVCTLTDPLDSARFISAFRKSFRDQVRNTDRNLARDARRLLRNVQEEFTPNTGVDCHARSRLKQEYCSICVRRIGFSIPLDWFARNEERAKRRKGDFVHQLREGACARDPCKRHAKQSPSPMPEPLTYIASPEGSSFPVSFVAAVVVELDSARIVFRASNDSPNILQRNLDGVIYESSGGSMEYDYFSCVTSALQLHGIMDRAAGAVASGCSSNWNLVCIEESLTWSLCPSVSGCVTGGISITNIC